MDTYSFFLCVCVCVCVLPVQKPNFYEFATPYKWLISPL